MAVAVGACCVEEPDATSGIRPWDETVERVRAGLASRAVDRARGGLVARRGRHLARPERPGLRRAALVRLHPDARSS